MDTLELEKRVKVLKCVSIFSETSAENLEYIAKLFSSVHVKPEECIFQKGDPGDSMYVIITGCVKIHDGSHVFITLNDEQFFGEFALIDSKLRTASATATDETELLKLDQKTFFSIYESNIEFSRGVLKSIVKRFNDKDFLEAQLTQKNREILKQKDELELLNKEITDSIRYAKRIQQAVLPSNEYIAKIGLDMFIMFKPKDIVSGDFFFVRYLEHTGVVVAAAADCTGHGVPGAFMSMLGVTFLNEIVAKPEVQHSGDVLDMLRKFVMKSLQQTGKIGEQKDGMDISLVAIYLKKNCLEFSGANNPLYLIRNNELIEYKSNKMPIGIHDRVNEPFTNNLVEYQKGDVIYLFSDGFADQFGGDRGKKFMYKNFKEYLLGIHQKPMAEQRDILDAESIRWRGPLEQIDDQIIMGIRF